MAAVSGIQSRDRECSYCHTRASEELFHRCPDCLAVLYCCEKCRECDWTANSRYSHRNWCSKMKKFMEHSYKLCDFSFHFTKETTHNEFDTDKYQQFLIRHGVYNQGLWKVESYNLVKGQVLHIYGTLPEFENPYVLPVESCILEDVPAGDNHVTDWMTYYNFRGFRLDSSIAILMQWPLTLYHILCNSLSVDYNVCIKDKDVVTVDLVGVEKEADMCILFEETTKLLKQKLDINMYGTEVCQTLDTTKRTYHNTEITLHSGLYHKKRGLKIPDVIIGFNAGLEAYTSWKDTVSLVKDCRIPAYFTDYCENSAELARMVLLESYDIHTSEVTVNPFRSPVRKLCDEHDLPWFSNAFMFHLKYT